MGSGQGFGVGKLPLASYLPATKIQLVFQSPADHGWEVVRL